MVNIFFCSYRAYGGSTDPIPCIWATVRSAKGYESLITSIFFFYLRYGKKKKNPKSINLDDIRFDMKTAFLNGFNDNCVFSFFMKTRIYCKKKKKKL